MQHTKIIILINSNNGNLNYNTTIYSIKLEIIKYFGIKNILGDILSQPYIHLSCEVTNEDLKEILKNIDNESVDLLAIVIPDKCNCIKNKVIYLSEEV